MVESDIGLARQALENDEEMDELLKGIFSMIKARIGEDPARVEGPIQLLSVSPNLERIADLATNIAEGVVFLVDGEVIRHQGRDPIG